MASVIITCNSNPDLDRIACAFAYQEFLSKTGQEAAMIIFGVPHEEVNYLLNRFNIVFPQNNFNEMSPASQIILVDTSDLRGLDKGLNPENVIEVIDHRKINDQHLFPKAKIQIELVGACATLIAEKYRQQGLVPSLQSAILIYGAIISNTLNFKANTITERDRAVADWLVENFALPKDLAQEMFLAKSDLGGKKLQERIRHDFAWFEFFGQRIGIAQIEMMGGRDLIEWRLDEIFAELAELKAELFLDFVFLSIVELKENVNFFLTSDKKTQKMLADIFDLEFVFGQATRPGLIMRKEITPLIKEYL